MLNHSYLIIALYILSDLNGGERKLLVLYLFKSTKGVYEGGRLMLKAGFIVVIIYLIEIESIT